MQEMQPMLYFKKERIMRKKTLALFLTCVLAAGMLAGCGNKDSKDNNQVENSQGTESAKDDQAAADEVAELIDAIYVQERTDKTDEQCAAAKEAWDKLTDAQKALVSGENADPDYFGRDTGDASKDDPLNGDEIGENVLDITEGVKKILSNSGTEQLIGHIDKLVVQLQDIGTNLDKTLTSIRGLAEPYTKLAQDTDKRLSAALEQASHVLSRIDNVAKETEMTVVSARGVVSKNSTTVIELNQAIREITEAARAVRVFANTLERNPEAVLRGKVR